MKAPPVRERSRSRYRSATARTVGSARSTRPRAGRMTIARGLGCPVHGATADRRRDCRLTGSRRRTAQIRRHRPRPGRDASRSRSSDIGSRSRATSRWFVRFPGGCTWDRVGVGQTGAVHPLRGKRQHAGICYPSGRYLCFERTRLHFVDFAVWSSTANAFPRPVNRHHSACEELTISISPRDSSCSRTSFSEVSLNSAPCAHFSCCCATPAAINLLASPSLIVLNAASRPMNRTIEFQVVERPENGGVAKQVVRREPDVHLLVPMSERLRRCHGLNSREL
jgi:hypothetical protein